MGTKSKKEVELYVPRQLRNKKSKIYQNQVRDKELIASYEELVADGNMSEEGIFEYLRVRFKYRSTKGIMLAVKKAIEKKESDEKE